MKFESKKNGLNSEFYLCAKWIVGETEWHKRRWEAKQDKAKQSATRPGTQSKEIDELAGQRSYIEWWWWWV